MKQKPQHNQSIADTRATPPRPRMCIVCFQPIKDDIYFTRPGVSNKRRTKIHFTVAIHKQCLPESQWPLPNWKIAENHHGQ